MANGAVKTLQLVRDLWDGALDLVYPPMCLVCKEPGGSYLCPTCLGKIILLKPPYCRKCGAPCPENAYLCADCRVREYAFESACSVGVYEGVLQAAIHAFKFGFHLVMADPLAAMMVHAFPATMMGRRTDVVVPIPIHHSRLVDRGFNQSEELARRLCRAVSLRLEADVLASRRRTMHQTNLPKDARAGNVQGAFEVRNAKAVRGKRVLVIDDVFTTGATLHEAAKVLRDAGAAEVHGFTLARSI